MKIRRVGSGVHASAGGAGRVGGAGRSPGVLHASPGRSPYKGVASQQLVSTKAIPPMTPSISCSPASPVRLPVF